MKKLATISTLILAVGGFVIPLPGSAENVAPSYEASPEVYKLLSENEHFRIITATWQPGQHDVLHSHAGPMAIYRLSDCKFQSHTADGKSKKGTAKEGAVSYSPAVGAHSVENIGTTACQALIIEKK